jgi:hypothetical protein
LNTIVILHNFSNNFFFKTLKKGHNSSFQDINDFCVQLVYENTDVLAECLGGFRGTFLNEFFIKDLSKSHIIGFIAITLDIFCIF